MIANAVPAAQRVTVLFVRHGQAVRDRERYEADDQRPLTARGRQTVTEISAQVALFAPQRLLCSHSLRALQTASLLAPPTGLVPEQVAGLQERVFSSLTGLTREQIAQRFGAAIAAALEHCSDAIELPGEETLQQARRRVCSAFCSLLDGTRERLAVVSHGGPHGWLLAAELGLSERQARVFRLDEASFSLLEFGRLGSGFRLRRLLALNTRQLPAGLARLE